MPNRLAHSSSPYLLQHANNPVDWYPWCSEAFEKAENEKKPIFLSIGYSSCHWCHVMAHESFENSEIAVYLNQHFVSIKVDREERPDIDEIYMNAVISLQGQGGWPLTVFLTPERKPFFGGTYYPPVRRYNLPGFLEVLQAVNNAWKNNQSLIGEITSQVTSAIQSNYWVEPSYDEISKNDLRQAGESLLKDMDWEFGGWGSQIKFPHPTGLEFLIRSYLSNPQRQEYIDAVKKTLSMMSRGGFYDLLDGGFSRYSTDRYWQIPHYEKMLYDNCQLGIVYLHAYLVDNRNISFKETAEGIAEFLLSVLKEPTGFFYSSIDADTDGEEGKSYLWSTSELQKILGEEDYQLFSQFHHYIPIDNSRNILFQRITPETNDLDLSQQIKKLYIKLLAYRQTRKQPQIDEKVIVSWNSLTLSFFSQLGWYLNNQRYLEVAENLAGNMISWMFRYRLLYRIKKGDEVSVPGMLEDYSALCLGLLDLYQFTGNLRWYLVAKQISEIILDKFSDPEGGFYDTTDENGTLIYKPKTYQDSSLPSGNAMAYLALYKLARLNEDTTTWEVKYLPFLLALLRKAIKYPLGYASWLCLADTLLDNPIDIAIIHESNLPNLFVEVLHRQYQPNLMIASTEYPSAPLPETIPNILKDKKAIKEKPTAYVCSRGLCRKPTNEPDELEQMLRQI